MQKVHRGTLRIADISYLGAAATDPSPHFFTAEFFFCDQERFFDDGPNDIIIREGHDAKHRIQVTHLGFFRP